MPHINWLENLSGASSAWRVESFDHPDEWGLARQFALKYFRRHETQYRVVEYVCATIASELDIGAPSVELLTIDEQFVEQHAKLRDGPSLLALAEMGRHVGIAWVENASALAAARVDWDDLAERTQPASIVACDALLQNVDRHDGNILVSPNARFRRADHVLVPIDWGCSLHNKGPGSADFDAIRDSREVREYVTSSSLRFGVRSADDFTNFLVRVQELSESPRRIQALMDWLPAEWNVPDEWRPALVEYVLQRLRFILDRLTRVNDDERLFPGWQLTLQLN